MTQGQGEAVAGARELGLTDTDVVIAVQTDVNVLFTGPADMALELARKVHQRGGWRHGPFTVIDCATHQGLDAKLVEVFNTVIPETVGPRPRLMQAGTVLLKEVGQIPRKLQRPLAGQLAELRAASRSRPRVLASTSENLWPKVVDGSFDDTLFYRLNVIQVRAAGGRRRTDG